MKLVPATEHDYYFKRTKNQEIIEEFLNSEHACAMIVDHGYKSAKTAQSSLTNSIRHFGYSHVRISIRGDRVFMFKI